MDDRQNFPTAAGPLPMEIREIWRFTVQNATSHSGNTAENRLSSPQIQKLRTHSWVIHS